MRELVISAALWTEPDDFYEAFLAAVGAPSWHGHNLDALWDSITHGDINRINAPYRVRIVGSGQTSEQRRKQIDRFVALMREAREAGIVVETICE